MHFCSACWPVVVAAGFTSHYTHLLRNMHENKSIFATMKIYDVLNAIKNRGERMEAEIGSE